MIFVRALLFIAGVFFLMAGMTFIFGILSPWYTSFLIGSILVSFSISTLWIAFTQTYRALVGGGLAALLFFGGTGVYLLRQGNIYGEIGIWLALFALWYFFLGLKASHKKEERAPHSVQYLFGIMLTLGLVEGIYLSIPVLTHFVWILQPEYAVLLGWAFIGSSLFFGWALLSPTWESSYPILYGLLAFDLLVIGPLTSLFRENVSVAVVPLFLWFALLVVVGSLLWTLLILYRRFFGKKESAST